MNQTQCKKGSLALQGVNVISNLKLEKMISISSDSCASIDSVSSDYGESTVARDLKAYQFFSKENTTRINIAYQKMMFWDRKVKRNKTTTSEMESLPEPQSA